MPYYKNRNSGVVLWISDERFDNSTVLKGCFELIPQSQYETYNLPMPSGKYIQDKLRAKKLLIKIPDNFNTMTKRELYRFAVLKHRIMEKLPDARVDEVRIAIKEKIKYANFEMTSEVEVSDLFPEEFATAGFSEIKSWVKRRFNIEIDDSKFMSLEIYRAHVRKMCLDLRKKELDESLVKEKPEAKEEQPKPEAKEEKNAVEGKSLASLTKKSDLLLYAELHNIDLSYFNGVNPTNKDLKNYLIDQEKGEIEL